MRRAMVTTSRIFFLSLLILMIAGRASAQTERVSIKPNTKPGQENRYQVNATVHTVVTAKGASGIASDVQRELAATIIVRTGASEKGGVIHEATIELINSRAAVDGADNKPDAGTLVGQKTEIALH